MDWFKLKENKCPKCGKDIMKGMKVETWTTVGEFGTKKIITHPCGFKIREKRMTEIVNSTLKQEQLAEKWRKEDECN